MKDCKNCKWFEKGNFMNFCNKEKCGIFLTLPKAGCIICQDWEKKEKKLQ